MSRTTKGQHETDLSCHSYPLKLMAEQCATVRDYLEKHCPNQHNDSLDCLVRVISHQNVGEAPSLIFFGRKVPSLTAFAQSTHAAFLPFHISLKFSGQKRRGRVYHPHYHHGIKSSHQSAIYPTAPLPSCRVEYLLYSVVLNSTQFWEKT